MKNKILSMSSRIRSTPFSRRVEAAGVKAYTVYNHMLLPIMYESFEDDYWHLCEHVQVWDVSCQRQVEVSGPDSQRLTQLMTPRNITKAIVGQCLYAPLCDENGSIINDPILIKLADDQWWLSIADSDVKFWAKGLAYALGLDAKVIEPDVWPLAVQGPKAEQLVARVFGDKVRDIRFFHSKMLNFMGQEMLVARSGWSKQGGFEIYLNRADLAEPLWDELFKQGQDLNVKPGSPNLIERIESGLLSYGGDITDDNNPFECGLDNYLNLDAEIDSISLPALRALQGKHKNQLVGVIFKQKMFFEHPEIQVSQKIVGKITSQTWSPRYKKHLALVMMQRDYLANHTDIEVNQVVGKICDIPFSLENLNSIRG